MRKIVFVSVVALFFTATILHWAFPGLLPLAGLLLTPDDQTLVYARGGDSVTLDPALAQDEESYKVMGNIFEGLVRLKPGTTEIEPCLAQTWQVSADGLAWTFYLRKNVTFHDGTPFDAAAVQFNVERQLPPRRTENMAYASFVFGMVEKVEIINTHTVRFILKYPYAPLLHNLAMPAAAPMVSPAAVELLGNDCSSHPVGTGPFKFGRWEKEQNIILHANPSYWGQPPQCRRLVFTVIKNSRFRALALKMGFADIIDGISPRDARLLAQSDCRITRRPGLDLSYLGFYTDKKPFDNPELRRAVSMSIDRERLVTTLYQTEPYVANGPLPPGVLGYSPDTRPLPYDPAGARELLARNGLAAGMKITIITYTNTRAYNPAGGEQLAAAIRADLAGAGIDATIKAYPWPQYKEALYREEGDAFLYGWISDNGDPDNFLYTLLSSAQIENGLNTARYRNQAVDTLLTQAQREMDPLRREALYRNIVQMVLRDTPWVCLNHSLILTAAAPDIDGFCPGTGYHPLNTVINK